MSGRARLTTSSCATPASAGPASTCPFPSTALLAMSTPLGIREGNPNARVGVNMATGHVASADCMYRALYPSNTVKWDFVGVDAYYGTWEPGGPEKWRETIDRIHTLCGGVAACSDRDEGRPAVTTDHDRYDPHTNRNDTAVHRL